MSNGIDSSPNGARKHNESQAMCAAALHLLRKDPLTKSWWEMHHPGSRLAPTVEQLRNGHGFTIFGDGSNKRPYVLGDMDALPTKVLVTDQLKEAYYASSHWDDTRSRRRYYDRQQCVLCGYDEDLVCHHLIYNLFAEQNRELMTVCDNCHETIHKCSRLKFPSGITLEQAERLGFESTFEPWLLPDGGHHETED